MVQPECIEKVIASLMRERATCELRFELEGREIAKLEMLEGRVRSAKMSGLNATSAARVIKRLPQKTRATVRHLTPSQLSPKTIPTGEWELPGT
jgi:hypothetical protein